MLFSGIDEIPGKQKIWIDELPAVLYNEVENVLSSRRKVECAIVTIKMISEACGLSIAAVSKALNGQPGISKEKAAMVRRTAQEMGYYPNAAAQTLKTKRSFNIGILFQNELAHEFFSLILEAVRRTVEARGYDITFLVNQTGQGAGYYEHAMRRQCDGVIIAQGDVEPNAVERLAESSLPVVSIERVFHGRTAVMGDNVGSMEEIVRYLYGLGHRRLAFIHGEIGDVTRARLAGFHRGCRACGIEVPDHWVVAARFHEPEDSIQATQKLLREKTPPDCILYPDDISCISGIAAAQGMGLSVPQDISCFGFDGIRLAAVMTPSIATYRQNAQDIGRLAAEELIAAIEDPKCYIPRIITVPGEIQPGGSVRDLTKTAQK